VSRTSRAAALFLILIGGAASAHADVAPNMMGLDFSGSGTIIRPAPNDVGSVVATLGAATRFQSGLDGSFTIRFYAPDQPPPAGLNDFREQSGTLSFTDGYFSIEADGLFSLKVTPGERTQRDAFRSANYATQHGIYTIKAGGSNYEAGKVWVITITPTP
jgi:hypothetical protein